MIQYILTGLSLMLMLCLNAQNNSINHQDIQEDLDEILNDISNHYVYFEDKGIDLSCLREQYQQKILDINNLENLVLFFEYLLDEFYDSHLILNTNTPSSYRLYAPIYATIKQDKVFISHIWQTQLENINELPNLIGAEIISINGKAIEQSLAAFPTLCNNKNNLEVKTWIINKILAGKYNQPRILKVKLSNNTITEIDLNQWRYKKEKQVLSYKTMDNIAYIRIHNSLGNNDLIKAFDQALDQLKDTKGLILDLRNTVDGGNSYVARGLMGRLISKEQAYQKHQYIERVSNADESYPQVVRSWIEYVSPRGKSYSKPVVVLVGKWTGSMGEGIAIGLDGMERAKIVGTEMERLAGEMSGFSFKHQNFGYRLSTARLFHINGTAREKFIPDHYLKLSNSKEDEILNKGLEILLQLIGKTSDF